MHVLNLACERLSSKITVGSETQPGQIPRSDPRLELLFRATGIYVYTVYYENSAVAGTKHCASCQDVTGYSQEDYDRDPSLWISMVHPDDRDEVLRKVIGAEVSKESTRFEHRVIHRDGSVRWVRNTIIPCLICGELVCCDGLIEDVTDRKRAERTLMRHTMQLTAAQEIQRRLLPQLAPQIPGTEIAGGLIPAEYAAGDFYDYLTMCDGSPAFVIGDVSGHGFGPALLMSLTHTLVRILTEIEDDIGTILAQINDFLVKETQEDRFVTLFFARYEVETRTITYASAGHPPAYIIDESGHLKAKLTSTTLPLGVLSDASFPMVRNIRLDRNDTMLMLTDGVLETPSPDHQLFGEARTIQLLQRHRHLSAPRIFEALHHRLREFSQQAVLADDITAVILKIH